MKGIGQDLDVSAGFQKVLCFKTTCTVHTRSQFTIATVAIVTHQHMIVRCSVAIQNSTSSSSRCCNQDERLKDKIARWVL